MPSKFMQFDFEPEWRDARAHEANGNLSAAKDIYEALIAAGPGRLYVRLRLSVIERTLNNYRAARQHALKAAESVRNRRGNDLSSVTRLLLTFDEGELVHDLIINADWSDPGIVKDSAILSQHL